MARFLVPSDSRMIAFRSTLSYYYAATLGRIVQRCLHISEHAASAVEAINQSISQ